MKKLSTVKRNKSSIDLFSRIPMRMRITPFLLAGFLMQANAENVYSQSAVISIEMNNATVEEVLNEIEMNSGYHFLYNNQLIDVDRKVSVKADADNIESVLHDLFDGTNVAYKIVNKQIVLGPKHHNVIVKTDAVSQTKVIKGNVTDKNGEAIIGANIMVKGTTIGTITDIDGNFVLNVEGNKDIIEVSYIGYKSQSISFKGKRSLSIVLQEDTETLDEVVVVGYGTQKKINLTGSVEVVSAKELENRPVTSASSLLQGQVAGMTFSTPSGGNAPGSNMTLQIRGQAALSGTTPPLVVIDGIPSEMSDFNALNPSDIESVSVLKDAAASAIYGARAPYGVVIVTTKMGKRGEKMSVNYSGNFGLVTPVRTPNMVDSYTFALAKNQAALNSRQNPYFSDDRLDIIQENVLHPGTLSTDVLDPIEAGRWGQAANYNNDFIDIWLRSSFRQQHNLSFKGGSEKSSYFVSAAFVDQPGNLNFVEDSDFYKRFNYNGGIEADINTWLKVTYRSKYSYEIYKEPATASDMGRSLLYLYAYGCWPVNPVYYPDGSLTERSRINVAVNGGERSTYKHSFDNILALDFSFMKGWTAHIDGTWRINLTDYQSLRKPVYGNLPDGGTYLLGGTESFLSKNNQINRYWTLQGYTNYEFKLNDNFFKVQLGGQIEENLYKKLAGNGKDLFVLDLPSISLANGDRNVADTMNDWATIGFFGRINYNYKERYLLELNGRYDGSARYSQGNRWGFFPSVSMGWNISNERFWKNIEPIVNFAKIRTSYGTLGNQGNSSGYLHVPTMSVGSQTPWIFNNERLPYVNTPAILNLLRTWEKITTFDVALETRFLDNRLSVEVDYFRRLSWDIIGPPTPKPAVLGTTPPNVNNAEFVTKGFELQVSWRDRITDKWDYNVGISLSDGMSEITKYNTTTNSINGWRVGKKFGEIWGYESDSFLTDTDFNEQGKLKVSQDKIYSIWYPGDVKYKDLDGDGIISTGNSTVDNHGDLKLIGNSTPRYRYGINLSTGYDAGVYGRFDISMFMEGVAKRDLFLGDSYFFYGAPPANWESSHARSVYEGLHLDFYRDNTTDPRVLDYLGYNTDSYFPRPYDSPEGNKNFQTSTKYLLNAAYMRLKNLTISYTLSNKLTSRIGVNNCKIYFSGENLFVLSGLPSYIDPEMVNGGRMYPQQAVYSFGINLGF